MQEVHHSPFQRCVSTEVGRRNIIVVAVFEKTAYEEEVEFRTYVYQVSPSVVFGLVVFEQPVSHVGNGETEGLLVHLRACLRQTKR